MTLQRRQRSITRALLIGVVLATLLSGQVALAKKPSPGGGGGGGQPPQTSPTNLVLTGVTPHSISLAWTAPRDTTGVIGYAICCAQNYATYTDGPQTSATVRGNGVEPGRAYQFLVYARYATNRLSNGSNAVNVTTPADTTAPTKPAVTVTDVRSTSATMAWSSVEEGPVTFIISRDGTVVNPGTKSTSGSFGFLQPSTTYTFTFRARDFSGNLSPVSDPVVVTTDPPNPDTTPPTSPPGLYFSLNASDGETWLNWSRSTDDQTPQSIIFYRVYINGVFDHATSITTNIVVYGPPQAENTYGVTAVDEAGNESAPSEIVVQNF